MSKKRSRKKKIEKAEEEPANFLGTLEEETAEAPPQEKTKKEFVEPQEETVKTKLEKLKPLPISVPCSTCQTDKKAYAIKIDNKGTFLFELECGHKEAYDFKVELKGEKAVADFGK